MNDDEGDEESIEYGALVLVRCSWENRPVLDGYIDTTPVICDRYKVADVIVQLGGPPDASKKCNAVARAVQPMQLRARYNNDIKGPYHLTATTPLTAEIMEAVVANWTPEDFARLDKTAKIRVI